jgi:transcriptional regulator with XRE-family HTH domain
MPSLAELRRSRKLTQTEVAAALGVTQATVSYWERGVIPQDMHAVAIMEYYDLTPDEYRAVMENDTIGKAHAVGRLLRKARSAERHRSPLAFEGERHVGRLSDEQKDQLLQQTEAQRAAAVAAGWLPADAAPVDPVAFPGWYVGPPKTSPED